MAEHHMRISPEIRQVVERFDRNRSGRLDYRELRSALRALGIDAPTNQAARVLATYDADGSGSDARCAAGLHAAMGGGEGAAKGEGPSDDSHQMPWSPSQTVLRWKCPRSISHV